MYNQILRGLRWFGELFTLNILAIVAIAVVGVAFLTWFVWTIIVHTVIKKRSNGCCVRHQNAMVRLFCLALGWVFFGVSLVAFIFMFYGAIFTYAIIHLALPIAVVSVIYLLCFIFQLFCNAKCRCLCSGSCEDCVVEAVDEEKDCVVEKAKNAAIAKEAKKKQESQQKSLIASSQESVKIAEENLADPEYIEPGAEESKPAKVAAKPVKAEKPRPVKMEKVKPVKAEKTKPVKVEKEKPVKVDKKLEKKKLVVIPQEEQHPEPVVWTPSSEPKVTVQTETAVTRNVSSSLSSTLAAAQVTSTTTAAGTEKTGSAYFARIKTTNELKAEHQNLKAEKEAMQKKLDEMRLQKIQSIGATGSMGGTTRTGYYSDVSTYSRTGSGYLQKVGGQYEESEVRKALQSLKETMDDIQRQIDARTE